MRVKSKVGELMDKGRYKIVKIIIKSRVFGKIQN